MEVRSETLPTGFKSFFLAACIRHPNLARGLIELETHLRPRMKRYEGMWMEKSRWVEIGSAKCFSLLAAFQVVFLTRLYPFQGVSREIQSSGHFNTEYSRAVHRGILNI